MIENQNKKEFEIKMAMTQPPEEGPEHTNEPIKSFSTKGKKGKKNKTPILDAFSVNLTDMAKAGELDPVIGRDAEIKRICEILSRRKKNNAVLVGEAGVGKTAIVEGFAMEISKRSPTLSRDFYDKEIYMLDMSSVLAGTLYRGQFEERMVGLLNELKQNRHIIIFIDEIHMIIGAGGAQNGTMDAANILKPALARGEIQCIGATTYDEYKKNIEKEKALARRFQKINVKEPTTEETIKILKLIKHKYEDYHKVTYSDDIIEKTIKMSGRYINSNRFPDKGFDVIDEAGAKTKIENYADNSEIKKLDHQITKIKKRKTEVVRDQNFEEAAKLRDKEKKLQEKIEILSLELERERSENKIEVTEDRIREVISMISNVPVHKVDENDSVRLKELERSLKESVIGQDQAAEEVSKVIKINKQGLGNPNRPIGCFMFIGSTGVGKTHFAKQIANHVFEGEDKMIRLDMSEYSDRFHVNRMTGAPPGYVGYEEGGQLTEKVKNNPYSVVLFDEIEKAHHSIQNIFLQILDEGFLTDGHGNKVDFRNTIIIMTSNVGAKRLRDFGIGVGFKSKEVIENQDKHKQEVLDKELNFVFSPEFINRFDNIIYFKNISEEDMLKIVDKNLEEVKERLENALEVKILFTNSLKQYLAKNGHDDKFGARKLNRLIEGFVVAAISEHKLNGKIKAKNTVDIDDNEEIVIK